MEYQVPQFIEVENKIFGPFTLVQFIYLAGGIGLSVILVLYIGLFFGVLLSIPVMMLSLALAFYKVNNRSFTDLLSAGFSFYTKGRLYLWKREEKAVQQNVPIKVVKRAEKLAIDSGKLKELAWSLDIKNSEGENNP